MDKKITETKETKETKDTKDIKKKFIDTLPYSEKGIAYC